METILVKPKDRAEEALVMDLMKRMQIKAEFVSEPRAEVSGAHAEVGEGRTEEVHESDFAADFELNVEEVKTRWPRMKNLQRTRELLYELMRSGYARLHKTKSVPSS